MTTIAAQEGVISMQNYENVGQYLRRIYHHLWSQINIMSSTGTRVNHWYHRSLPFLCSLSLWICSSLTFGFVWKQHLDLCSKTFIFPLDLTFHIFAVPRCQFHPAEWHHIFLLNCPEKRTIFGTVCTSKVEYSRAMCEIVFCYGKEFFLGFWKFALFCQNKGLCGGWGTCGASSDNQAEAYICSRNPQVAKNGQQVHD